MFPNETLNISEETTSEMFDSNVIRLDFVKKKSNSFVWTSKTCKGKTIELPTLF